MKRHTAANGRRLHPRFGGIFQYYFAYLMMTGSVLTASGFCLHAILKSSEVQVDASQLMKSTIQATRQLRRDTTNATAVDFVDGHLSMQIDDVTMISWYAEKMELRRTLQTSGKLTGSERFIFPLGSKVTIQAFDAQRIVVRVEDPTPLSVLEEDEETADDASRHDGLPRTHSMEMFVFRNPTGAVE